MKGGLLGGALWVFFGVVCGRFLGLAREVVISRGFGVSIDADIAILVLTVPNLVLDLLIGGAMGAALVPEFVRRIPSGSDGELFRRLLILVGGIFAGIATVLGVFSSEFLIVLAPGMESEYRDRVAGLVAIGLLSLPLTAMTAVAQARLHACGRFALASLGNPLFNGILLAPMLVIPTPNLIAWLPIIIIVAAGFRAVILIGAAWNPKSGRDHGDRTEDMAGARIPLPNRYALALGSGMLVLMFPILARAAASWIGEGSIAVVNYASKAVDLPVGACLTVFSVVLLPQFSRLQTRPVNADGSEGVSALLHRGMLLSALLSIPIAMTLWSGARLVAVLLLGGGVGVKETTQAIQILCAGIPALAFASIIQVLFQSRLELGLVFRCGLFSIMPISLGMVLVGLGYGGLPMLLGSWVLSNWVFFLGLTLSLRRLDLWVSFRSIWGKIIAYAGSCALVCGVTTGLIQDLTDVIVLAAVLCGVFVVCLGMGMRILQLSLKTMMAR